MTDSGSPLHAYYAARSAEYERIYAKPERQAELQQLQASLPPRFAGCELLEVACGTGYWTQFLARSARGVVAVDAVPEVLELAAAKDLPAGRVRFAQADAYELPDSLGMFDAAFAGFWWSHVPVRERGRFLRSLAGRLRPGAHVLLLDNRYVEGSSTPIARRDADGNTYQCRRLEDGREYEVLKNFPDEAGLRADLAPFGRDVAVEQGTYFWTCCWRVNG